MMWFKLTKVVCSGLLGAWLLTGTFSFADTFKTRPDGPDAERLGI